MTRAHTVRVPAGETRRDQLRRWLAEREEKKKLEKARRAREPGPFRPAGAVQHKVAEFSHMSAAARSTATGQSHTERQICPGQADEINQPPGSHASLVDLSHF